MAPNSCCGSGSSGTEFSYNIHMLPAHSLTSVFLQYFFGLFMFPSISPNRLNILSIQPNHFSKAYLMELS
jgi:hypothetical protein